MAAFFAKTWFLWYAVAALIIMRWFHVTSSDVESDVQVLHRVDGTDAGKAA
jgi:hypothetical protein